jgi:hypothetical protein
MAVLVLRECYRIALNGRGLTLSCLVQLILLAVHYVIIFFGIPETREGKCESSRRHDRCLTSNHGLP